MIIRSQPEYELLDSGNEMKIERYGSFTVARPDPQAIWNKGKDQSIWDNADATFIKSRDETEKGHWHIQPASKNKFQDLGDGTFGKLISLGPIKLFARLTSFKHTAIFPEQLCNWVFAQSILQKHLGRTISTPKYDTSSAENGVRNIFFDSNEKSVQKPKILNLFGYTGGASIACALSGADVTHVDASKSAITWAKENMLASGLNEDAIRWILEDVVVFVKKELRRGNRYDGIIMDPPVFGRGAKGEVWKIEKDLVSLLAICYQLLSPEPLFFILNGYASGYSSVAYANNIQSLLHTFGGVVEHGELLIEESTTEITTKFNSGIKLLNASETTPLNTAKISLDSTSQRFLPCGIVARWSRG